ncbi:MAG: fumarylacetoacetate hydrolase family protein [Burkholderiaceae bacterium]|nr:fumarylacetoacetate hydrolase family protein [Burkholderiaceae bacterium]
MKLATLKDGSRDGQLAVVSRDLARAHLADTVAPTMQRALDDWPFVAPQLAELSRALEQGKAPDAFAFDPRRCMAPLPRAYQWLDASSYAPHLERLARARGAQLPPGHGNTPMIYQGASDDFLGPHDAAVFDAQDQCIDLEAEIAVIVDDLPMGATPEHCGGRIRLLALANDWSLRAFAPAELATGFGFLRTKPATAFAPVAVTPDELGTHWRDARVHLPVIVHCRGVRVGQADAGTDSMFGFDRLLAHAAGTRNLRAGTILGAGTVSNHDPAAGWSCIAEARALETIELGAARTAYLAFGDRVRIEVLDERGGSVFGAIDQEPVARRR